MIIFLIIRPTSHSPEPPLSGTLETISTPTPIKNPTSLSEDSQREESNHGMSTHSVIVDVKGQVAVPGVYTLPTGSRVLDAVQLAGGLLPTAEEKAMNLAAKLMDEMVIYVPEIGETDGPALFAAAAQGTQSENDPILININSADEAALTALPGIGPAKARAIIAHRDENGPFQSVEAINEVSGIGEQTFKNLKDFISIK